MFAAVVCGVDDLDVTTELRELQTEHEDLLVLVAMQVCACLF